MDINELRKDIDRIDDELVKLFTQRMQVSEKVAQYKKERGLPILVPAREREKLKDVAEKAGPDMANYTRVLYSMIFELSRSYQGKLNDTKTELYHRIIDAIETTPRLFPQAPMVACQGVEGAYSQIACEKIFKAPMIMYFKNFEAVFNAIEQGLCQYGILPLENSTAGSVKKVYDLMISHSFSIVRTFRLKVDHNLLVNPGTKLEDIKEIYSHEQAISQCAQFLHGLKSVKIMAQGNLNYQVNTKYLFGCFKDFAIHLNSLAGAISDSVLAAVGVCTKVMMFPFSIILGFGTGFQPVAGFNFGAKRFDRVHESYRFCAKVAFIGSLVMAIFVGVLADTFVVLFAGSDEEMRRIGVICMVSQCFALPVHAWVAIVNMLCAGLGNARGALILSTSRQGTCFLPILYLLAWIFGAYGIACVQAIADILSLVLAIPILRKTRKAVNEAEHQWLAQQNS